MFILRRLLLILNAVIWCWGLEIIRANPNLWWLLLASALPLLLLTVFDFTKRQLSWRLAQFLILPVLFCTAVFIFLMFIENVGVYRVLGAFSAVALYMWLSQVLNYHYFSGRYQAYTLESLSLYLDIITIFFLSGAFFAGLVFFSVNLFLVLPVAAVTFGLLSYQVFWSYKFSWAQSWLLIFVNTLVLVEILAALSFGPMSFYVNALILTIIYYLITIISRDFLREELSRRRVVSYAILSAIIIILLFLTAQWS
jgi:hypothetical protein